VAAVGELPVGDTLVLVSLRDIRRLKLRQAPSIERLADVEPVTESLSETGERGTLTFVLMFGWEGKAREDLRNGCLSRWAWEFVVMDEARWWLMTMGDSCSSRRVSEVEWTCDWLDVRSVRTIVARTSMMSFLGFSGG